tara:strand:+ start:35173 stop:35730 length:558 start_codon:yes stop_codon:yes gene_type:complete
LTEDDEELQSILNEMDDSDPLPGPQLPRILAKSEDPKETKKKESDVMSITPMKVERTKVEKLTNSDAEDASLDMKSMMGKYRLVFEEVVENCRNDRTQVQDLIDHFFETLANNVKIPTIYIEKFPELLKTKNDIATTTIRAMDSFSKLVSATKGSEILNTVNVNFDADSLEALLQAAEDKQEDDE